MDQTLTLRAAVPSDLGGVDALLARSYPRLLAADYPPSVMVLALPIIARARPELLASGRYFVVADEAGRIVGAGGYSQDSPQRDGQTGEVRAGLAHVRHFAADPTRLRQGIARAIMGRVVEAAMAEGANGLECLSTRTAVAFYAAMGFAIIGPVQVPLRPGIDFPAVRMFRGL
jgi:GNAT superfamily N-acetyltransferase